jgi:hypothetical protein
VRPVPPEEYERSYARWDHDDTLLAVFTLSRLIRDNAYSTEYAARVVELSDGRIQIMPGPVNLEGALAYRARAERGWLDTSEARELAALLGQFWASECQFSERVRNAIWLAEQSARCKYDFNALLTIVAGLEALLNTGPRQNTKQFAQRASDLAGEIGIDGFSRHGAKALRPALRRGARPPLAPDLTTPRRAHSELQRTRSARDARTRPRSGLAARAVRRCIEDRGFAAHFANDQDVREKWPVSDGDGSPL